MRIIFISAGLAVALAMPGVAFAQSCTDLFNSCVRNEGKMQKPASRCNKPLQACLTQCRAGKPAAFVGPSTGRHYPAVTCG